VTTRRISQFRFSFYRNRPVQCDFSGGQITSDAGLLPLRAFDQRHHLTRWAAKYYQEKMTTVSGKEFPRLVIDLISGMTERQCVDHFQTLTGICIKPSFKRAL
jgi:dGTP triphosphohydrolase